MTIRPRNARWVSGTAGLCWFAVAAFFVLRSPGSEAFVSLAIAFGAAAVAFTLMSLSMARSKLEWDGQALSYYGLLGRRLIAAAPGNGRVVEMTTSSQSHKKAKLQLWLDGEGRTRVGIIEDAWDAGELESIRQRAGLKRETETEALTAKEIRQRYPGSIKLYAAYPGVSGTLFVIFVLLFAAVAETLAG